MITLAICLVAFWVFAPPVLVAIGLPFKVRKGHRKLDGVIVENFDLPDWLKWLQNEEDGLTGDKRGDYWTQDRFRPGVIPKRLWASPLFKMWWWSGIRNPWNYLKRSIFGIDIRNFSFHKLAGQDYVRDDLDNQGFQILYAKSRHGRLPRPMLYYVREIRNGRGICLQIGWKIKLSHNDVVYSDEYDNFKGLTFEPNPYKDLT